MAMLLILILASLLIFAIVHVYGTLRIYTARCSLMRKHNCEPPKRYPHKEPILGLDLVYTIIQSAKKGQFMDSLLQRHRTLGRTFQTTSLGTTIINTIEPKILSEVFATKSDHFGVAPIRDPPAKPLVGRGIFTTDGAEWIRSRALVRPCFARVQVADLALLKVHVDRLLELIPRDGSTIDLQGLFCRLVSLPVHIQDPMCTVRWTDLGQSLDSSTEFLFGESLNSLLATNAIEVKEFIKSFNVAQDGVDRRVRLGGLRFLYQGKRWLEACAAVHSFTDRYVMRAVADWSHEPRKISKPGNQQRRHYILLDEMAKVTEDEMDLRYQILNVFIAGHESTAIALSSIFFHLARTPMAWQRLRSEVVAIGTAPLTFESLKSIQYLRYVISESLRLKPVAPLMTRICFRDTVLSAGGGPDGLCPVLITKGQLVNLSTYALHRDKSFWGDDAESFRPERWETVRPKWEYLPFGGGTRICPAQQLALTEVGYVVVRLVQHFKNIENRDPKPWEELLRMTLVSKNGVQVGLIPG